MHNDDVEKRNDAHWMKHNPFKDEECTFCKVLPLCMGGCPLLKSLQHKKFCLKWKTDLEDALINKYYSSKK
ncbi:SPASM domain-containing protein [Megasphaera sp.]|uniref:SPASM domain-containing protein n=1 Tax=Megasphaera sp. TaxID=2023260 RepID=UPI003F7DE322